MIGRPLGEFLEAIFSNDLIESIRKADNLNAQCLKEYAQFLVNVAPRECYGSKKAYVAWLSTHGLLGRRYDILAEPTKSSQNS